MYLCRDLIYIIPSVRVYVRLHTRACVRDSILSARTFCLCRWQCFSSRTIDHFDLSLAWLSQPLQPCRSSVRDCSSLIPVKLSQSIQQPVYTVLCLICDHCGRNNARLLSASAMNIDMPMCWNATLARASIRIVSDDGRVVRHAPGVGTCEGPVTETTWRRRRADAADPDVYKWRTNGARPCFVRPLH